MSDTIKKLAVLLLFPAAGLVHAGDVHIGVSIAGEVKPGVYGRVNIGTAPPPPVVYQQPVVIVQEPRRVRREPLYLHVPPGHAKNWGKHCRKYDACGHPVYFVKSVEYEPRGHKHKHRHHDRHDRDDDHRDHRDHRDHGRHDNHDRHGGHGRHH